MSDPNHMDIDPRLASDEASTGVGQPQPNADTTPSVSQATAGAETDTATISGPMGVSSPQPRDVESVLDSAPPADEPMIVEAASATFVTASMPPPPAAASIPDVFSDDHALPNGSAIATSAIFPNVPSAAAGPSLTSSTPQQPDGASSSRRPGTPPSIAQVSVPDPTALLPASSVASTSAVVRRPSSSAKRMARTGYIYDPLMMLHCPDGYTPTLDHILDSGDSHPEEPMRIKRIYARLAETGLIARMKKLDFEQVTLEQVKLVHGEDHWDKVQGTETLSDEYIQASKHYYDQLSLYVCRETAHCARLSCGGVVQACLSVCTGEVRNAFAIVRPPGHHAEPDEHMGFCFYNNVAVAAKEVQRLGLAKKVLILDWDVHHGNGTQRAFWDDPSVLYVSIHRHDGGRFYPTSDFGALDMVGSGAGEGFSVNIPWPSGGFGDADYIYAFQKIIMPIAYEFAPDLVIISAGFDAADGDTLGECNVTPPAYGHMTHMLCALAGGKVVVALEGGYNLEAISRSSLAVAQVLLGETPPELGALEASEAATEVIHQVSKVQSKYWKGIDVKACEPPEVGNGEEEKPVIPIPDLLKIHRAHHMFRDHKLFQIPLASPELESAFGGQVICNEGVYEAGSQSALVVFVHDFGNLRVETDGVATTNVHLTNSYLLDTSDAIVNWVVGSGFNIIDVNVLAQLPTQFARTGPKMIQNAGPQLEGQLMRYLWDNYIELSEAENVVLIGHGTGCQAVMELVNHREVERKVKAVVQVAGLHSLVRIDPKNEARRDWFRRANRIFVPSAHPILEDDRVRKRLGGQVFTSERAKVVDVLNDVLPQIQAFVQSKLVPPSLAPMTNGNGDAGLGSLANPIVA